jgi:hypothetical protein
MLQAFYFYLFAYVFMVYLTTLSVTRTIQSRMVEYYVNNSFEMIRKEAVVAYFEVLYHHLP